MYLFEVTIIYRLGKYNFSEKYRVNHKFSSSALDLPDIIKRVKFVPLKTYSTTIDPRIPMVSVEQKGILTLLTPSLLMTILAKYENDTLIDSSSVQTKAPTNRAKTERTD